MKAFALCYLIGVTAAGPLPDPFNAQSLNPMRANIQTTKLNIHNRAKGFESLPDSYFQGFNGTDSSSLSLTFRGLEEEAVEPPPGTIFYDIPPYQWDQTHGNSADKERVKAAWNMAMALAQAAVDRLTRLDEEVTAVRESDEVKFDGRKRKRPERGQNKVVRKWVARNEPAYTQLFGADLDNILTLRDNFELIVNNVENQNANLRNNNLIYLTAMEVAKVGGTNEDLCKSDKENSPGTQAFIIKSEHLNAIQHLGQLTDVTVTIPPPGSYVMNFCKQFFVEKDLQEQLELLRTHSAKKEDICNLAIDTTARIILHEWTHFDFTIDTNRNDIPKDDVGFKQAASYSTRGPVNRNQPSDFTNFSSRNADSYAQYGVYNYLNELQECQGVHWSKVKVYEADQCKTDVWPPGEGKFVRNTWPGYSAEGQDP